MKLLKGAEMMKALRAVTVMSLERNRVAASQKASFQSCGSGSSSSSADHHVDHRDLMDGGASICSVGDVGLDEFEGDSECSIDNECDEYYDTASVAGSIGDINHNIYRGSSSSRGGVKVLRLSIAEKKKLKKKGMSPQEIREVIVMRSKTAASTNANDEDGLGRSSSSSSSRSLKRSRGGEGLKDASSTSSNSFGHSMSVGLSDQFRDARHYMSYGDEDVHASFAEESMQPQSGLRSSESISK